MCCVIDVWCVCVCLCVFEAAGVVRRAPAVSPRFASSANAAVSAHSPTHTKSWGRSGSVRMCMCECVITCMCMYVYVCVVSHMGTAIVRGGAGDGGGRGGMFVTSVVLLQCGVLCYCSAVCV